MNTAMVQRLMLKDWYFNRWAISAMVLLGLLALLPIAIGGEGGFFAGSILLITAVISIGIQLTMVTVVHERTEHTLPFVMSLPISAREYTTAKLLGNLLIFGTAWGLLAAATLVVIADRPELPDGLIPFALVVLGSLFLGYVLTLTVAIVSESLPWTVVAIVLANFVLQGVMYGASHAPGAEARMRTDSLVWLSTDLWLLGAEIGLIVVLLALTFYLQARKTDFL